MTVLITGFEPFGGDSRNPSDEITRALDGRQVEGRAIVGVVLPCVFGDAVRALRSALRHVDPELVVCLGQAGGRAGLTLERVAINVDDARIADNAGQQPIDEPIVSSGPAAYWSTLPIKACVAALCGEGLEASVSQTAGTFVCNHLFYGLMRSLRRRPGVRGGFVHVPWLPEQATSGASSMELGEMVRGVEVIVRTSLATATDLKVTGGATK